MQVQMHVHSLSVVISSTYKFMFMSVQMHNGYILLHRDALDLLKSA